MSEKPIMLHNDTKLQSLMKHLRITVLALLFLLVLMLLAYLKFYTTKPTSQLPKNNAAAINAPASNRGITYSLTNPSSIWVIVNKQHPLNPLTYTPSQLTVPNVPLRSNITAIEKQVSSVIVPALEDMVASAKQQGVLINLQSGYRSYELQQSLYNYYVQTQGQTQVDMYSAKPGYSEHQTGLAVDLGDINNPSCDLQDCFASTAAGKWLAANAYKFGFILRYPDNKQNITGYGYEPWHFRYVGVMLAEQMKEKNISTLEEYFNVQ